MICLNWIFIIILRTDGLDFLQKGSQLLTVALDDPAKAEGTEEEIWEVFQRVCAEIVRNGVLFLKGK